MHQVYGVDGALLQLTWGSLGSAYQLLIVKPLQNTHTCYSTSYVYALQVLTFMSKHDNSDFLHNTRDGSRNHMGVDIHTLSIYNSLDRLFPLTQSLHFFRSSSDCHPSKPDSCCRCWQHYHLCLCSLWGS